MLGILSFVSTENRIHAWPCVGLRALPVVYSTGELSAATVFLRVLWPYQLANALASTGVRIFGNSATFFYLL